MGKEKDQFLSYWKLPCEKSIYGKEYKGETMETLPLFWKLFFQSPSPSKDCAQAEHIFGRNHFLTYVWNNGKPSHYLRTPMNEVDLLDSFDVRRS